MRHKRLLLALLPLAALVATLPALADAAAARELVQALPSVVEGCAESSPPPAGFADELRLMLKDAVDRGNLFFALLLVLLAGFGVTLTPCVYPLIPITLSIFGARQAPSKLQGFFLSATYVGGMVLLYSVLGVGFALAGKVMGGAMQSPFVTVGVALFCFVMAASMFGAFELALPSSLQGRLARVGGSGYRGAFLMGLVAGLIAAPCTGPVLTFILTLIARDGDVAKGALFMVVFALGIGIPFLILGTFSQALSRIPKTGAWTEAVKSVFGILMVIAGLYFASLGSPALTRLLGALGTWGLWVGPAMLLAGAVLGGLHLSFKFTSPQEKGRKAVGLLLCLLGATSVLGWSVAEPVLEGGGGKVAWAKVGNEDDAVARFEALLAAAKDEGRPVMIDFYADWCAACKELDKHVYVHPAVRAEAGRFTNVKIDATDDTDGLREIQARFGVVGLPTVAFLNSQGHTCPEPRVTGFIEAERYLPLMQGVW
jgi:thioredoxin:protein disulfide reductase